MKRALGANEELPVRGGDRTHELRFVHFIKKMRIVHVEDNEFKIWKHFAVLLLISDHFST